MADKVHFYLFDTRKQAEAGQDKINELMKKIVPRYNASRWAYAKQIPIDSPRANFAGKWLVKLPYIKRDLSSTYAWKMLKDRITELPAYDPERKFEVSKAQYKEAMKL